MAMSKREMAAGGVILSAAALFFGGVAVGEQSGKESATKDCARNLHQTWEPPYALTNEQTRTVPSNPAHWLAQVLPQLDDRLRKPEAGRNVAIVEEINTNKYTPSNTTLIAQNALAAANISRYLATGTDREVDIQVRLGNVDRLSIRVGHISCVDFAPSTLPSSTAAH